MSSQSPRDPARSRELLVVVGGGLLVLVCCAGPALLAAGLLGALGGALRSPVLVGIAVLAIAITVGALVLRRTGRHDERRSCCPPASHPTDQETETHDSPARPPRPW